MQVPEFFSNKNIYKIFGGFDGTHAACSVRQNWKTLRTFEFCGNGIVPGNESPKIPEKPREKIQHFPFTWNHWLLSQSCAKNTFLERALNMNNSQEYDSWRRSTAVVSVTRKGGQGKLEKLKFCDDFESLFIPGVSTLSLGVWRNTQVNEVYHKTHCMILFVLWDLNGSRNLALVCLVSDFLKAAFNLSVYEIASVLLSIEFWSWLCKFTSWCCTRSVFVWSTLHIAHIRVGWNFHRVSSRYRLDRSCQIDYAANQWNKQVWVQRFSLIQYCQGLMSFQLVIVNSNCFITGAPKQSTWDANFNFSLEVSVATANSKVFRLHGKQIEQIRGLVARSQIPRFSCAARKIISVRSTALAVFLTANSIILHCATNKIDSWRLWKRLEKVCRTKKIPL